VCGIVGSYQLDLDIDDSLDRLAHRGPDGRGVVEHEGVTHGHVRLSVQDLSEASAQPFRYRDGVLSYNGELWNGDDLRERLTDLGHDFKTTGDTEVLAAALWEWGDDAFAYLDGMYAFCWTRPGTRILARDRFGKIPLYIARKGSAWAWASEVKAIPGRGASPLWPGFSLDMDSGRLRRHYSVPLSWREPEPLLPYLEDGVLKRLVSDAPLCCLASGGLDSTLIMALAKTYRPDLEAFHSYIDPDSPDLAAARRICEELEIPLTEIQVRPPTEDDLVAAVRSIESPMKAQVEIAVLCIPLAKAIAQNGFKVCLSGEAADELFGGYGSMAIQGSKATDSGWQQIRLKQVEKMSRGNFVRCNKAFMAGGVECRLPYMDRAMVELVLNLRKRDCKPGKAALKDAARGFIPSWVVSRSKATFQGAGGGTAAAAEVIANPRRFYESVYREMAS
jgi:asparagine synthase (glutamine-hydrolysing)